MISYAEGGTTAHGGEDAYPWPRLRGNEFTIKVPEQSQLNKFSGPTESAVSQIVARDCRRIRPKLDKRKGGNVMWRALFMAVGIMLVIVGVECMVIDSAAVYGASDASGPSFLDPSMPPSPSIRTVKPSEGMPWILMAVGAIVILYSVTLRKGGAPAGH